MLIVPLSGRMSLRNPPIVTIGIILITCVVFFFFQSADRGIQKRAQDYYLGSDLASIETAAYEQYLEYGTVVGLTGFEAPDRRASRAQEDLFPLIASMHGDGEFMARLEKNQIITPEMEIYPSWREKRDRFNAILSHTMAVRWGFRPADWNVRGAFAYMFLHGGLMHLAGNMIFLWLVGCMLEMAWGRILYLGLYVAGGFFAAALFGLVHHAGTAPLIGASGAVAALMGAYAVFYGRHRIKVFYSLGFYFNYTMVPGVVILVLWMGNEMFQLFFGPKSQVAYAAHIGGLASGAAMGLIHRTFSGRGAEQVLEGEHGPGGSAAALLDRALKQVEKLDMQGARDLLRQVLAIDPNNRAALTQMYHADKLNPESDEFHASAGRLLENLVNDRQTHREALAVYREYLEKAEKPRLPLPLLFAVSSYFAATGHLEEAEKIMGLLLKKKPDLEKMPEGLLHVARACLKEKLESKARSYLQVICMRYPLSAESSVARRLLDDLGD
ncbi:MAG TPA: rhomboid family intramembrane serine protease [Deltaproteobacteria bacterium]|mgnify:FL=1|nr:rhomboid family intramembrane serine protease [Deltaproteobacteria bacterium]